MPSPGDALTAAIAAAGGAIAFDQFMDLALYGPEGFYTSGGTAGRRGDFITSPEVGPLFGTVLARAVAAEWEAQGCPSGFTVVEVGAGPGTLARSLRPALAALAQRESGDLRYVAVELAEGQRSRHPAEVESTAELPEVIEAGVVIANELLDNLPFRLAVFDGAWREAFVTMGSDGRCAEILGAPIDPLPESLPERAAHGARAPLQDRAHHWVASARAALKRGRVIAIDYCTPRTAELALLAWRSWLRTYRAHERGQHYLGAPGSQDITAQVCVDQLPEPDEVRSQAQFLSRWGIDELVDEGRRAWEAAAARPDLAAITMRSRVTERDALMDPTGLGDFTVLEWRVGSASTSCGIVHREG